MPLSAPFRYPVDSKAYPDYYQLIKKPMDLQTLRNEINKGSYSKIRKALDDLRLIWSNCITFNQEGSDICESVLVLGEEVENLIGVR